MHLAMKQPFRKAYQKSSKDSSQITISMILNFKRLISPPNLNLPQAADLSLLENPLRLHIHIPQLLLGWGRMK